MSNHLFIIDPQLDFCDGPANGALAVPGAWEDMNRLADYIIKNKVKIDEITVSLDSHHFIDIGHPAYWTDADGNEPTPITLITLEDFKAGKWTPKDPANKEWAESYITQLEASSGYIHTVWPTHCLVGTPGHTIHPELMNALIEWQNEKVKNVNYVLKGLNPQTEHYSAVKAEISIPGDPHTSINHDLMNKLKEADSLFISGEALSHCVKATVEDIVNLEPSIASKITFLTDTMSSVPATEGSPDFPKIGEDFLKEMQEKGASCKTTQE